MFFIVFFSLYSGVHLYALIKIKRALGPDLRAMIVLGVFMALMVAAPVLVRILERHSLAAGARSLAFAGYLWMGLLFLFVCGSLLIDAGRVLLWATGKVSGTELAGFLLTRRQAFFLLTAVSLAITFYGFLDALNIRSEQVVIRTHKLPAGTDRVRIVQISDVHLGLIVGKTRLERILKRVEAAGPDLLVSTGDLVDGQPNELAALAQMLRRVSATYGKYAVTGNHEFYAGIDTALRFTSEAGFTVLRGESRAVGGVLNLAGVDDPAGGFSRMVSEENLLDGMDNRRFAVLLKHRPLTDTEATGRFDLQLSGHTHRGQIFPFTLIVARVYSQIAGLLAIEENRHLYVSRGSGTWGPPVRFLAAPEVTVIDLIREDAES